MKVKVLFVLLIVPLACCRSIASDKERIDLKRFFLTKAPTIGDALDGICREHMHWMFGQSGNFNCLQACYFALLVDLSDPDPTKDQLCASACNMINLSGCPIP